MIRFYANENFPLPVVQHLRKFGYEVITLQETGLAGKAISDEEVLKYSIKQMCVLITFNRKHFIRLHKENPDHHGIIVCTFDPDFKDLANRIHQAISKEDNLFKKLIRINRPMR